MSDSSESDIGLILAILRVVRDWLQADVAAAAQVPPSAVSDYERGKKTPGLRVLRRLVSGMGFHLSAVDEVHGFLVGLRLRHRIPQALDRQEVPALWARLGRYPVKTQLALVSEATEFQNWALCEFLCFESVRAAAGDAGKAVALAELAVALADHMPGENPWLSKLRGFAWTHLGNARRVSGDLARARETVTKAEALWLAGRGDPTALLSESWLLGMKASLKVAERRLPEALSLLDQAVELDQGCRFRGTLLVARAKALEELGDSKGSIAVLEEAAPFIDATEDPRLNLCRRHNLLWVLTTAGEHEAAAALLPEVAALSRRGAQELDVLRLRWAEGRIAGGTGQYERAVSILGEVRGELARRGIAYDGVLVSLELAVLYAERGALSQVKAIARHLVPILKSQDLHEEALAALLVFRRAAEVNGVTVDLLRRISSFLYRARHYAGLRYGDRDG